VTVALNLDSAVDRSAGGQLIDMFIEHRGMSIRLAGEVATGRTARPICRLAALQLLAIASYYSSLCLARQQI